MSIRAEQMDAHPEFPWLDLARPETIHDYLERSGWLESDEKVLRCEPAGEGNMNLTVRARTDRRSLILKQARPWVEKYDEISAPWERSRFERRFYEAAASIPAVAARMPALLGSSDEHCVLLIEDLGSGGDCSSLYAFDDCGVPSDSLDDRQIADLAGYLAALHQATRGPRPELANRQMRALNHAHIYEIPMASEAPLDLEAIEPGLLGAANELKRDIAYQEAVAETGRRYLADGPHLVHGDYFPGSWLRTRHGLRFIDPEFCFYGDAEFDVGVALAHLALAGQPREAAAAFLRAYARDAPEAALEPKWLARYAACEVMRRLIGVAQLPIPPTCEGGRAGFRAATLLRSRVALRNNAIMELW